jgi:hypothetical protein
MLTKHDPANLTRAILAAGRNGSPRPRVVSATIFFDENGDILTYLIDSQVFHMARGGDAVTIIQHLVAEQVQAEKATTSTRKRGESK